MRSVRSKLLVGIATAALVLLAACGQTFAVTVNDTGFDPQHVKTSDQSDSVQWNNTGTTNHTATSNGGGAFFDTGQITAGTMSSKIAFDFAGVFPYHDTDNPSATGNVEVPLCVSSTASPGDSVFVQWAGCPSGGVTIPSGFHADVQFKAPGDQHWHNWKTNQTGTEDSASFTVKHTGIYRFRAHYVKDHVASSNWTPPAVCNVTR